MKTQKTKEQLIKEFNELNEEFKAKLGKENVVAIAYKMCQIEDELLAVYGYSLFED